MSSSSASTARQGTPALYRPQRPERTLLHGLVREHLEMYLSLARQRDSEIGPPPVSPSRAPSEEELDFGPEDDAQAGFDFHQDRPREEEFDFDQRTEWDDDSEA